MNLVIVESPAKAKTINKYLGKDYTVLASFGHIRDLPPKNGSVLPEENFRMLWELTPNAKKSLSEIKKASKKADRIILATDPDREGEAISWHILEVLKDAGLTKNKTVERVAFNEVTKTAIQKAMSEARDIDSNLVDAYMTRRSLDYLVGFNLSPVLWRKLPGSRSAGRVQSVALRLICERESEIEIFKAEEYWSILAKLKTPRGDEFDARLTHLNGVKLAKLDLKDEASANKAVAAIKAGDLYVSNIEQKAAKRHPAAPFRTSTLQQEAARKLYFGASNTMRIAQNLYEGVDIGGDTVGLITYMRTDGTTLSDDALNSIRGFIKKEYGDKYLPDNRRIYKSKNKNAQEAHEAIRPTDVSRTPESVAKYLSPEQLKLYTLIWQRTVACQMESALFDQLVVTIDDNKNQVLLRANGSRLAFDGFLKVYQESKDDDAEDDGDDTNRLLPAINDNEKMDVQNAEGTQHFTQPPPRYTEASLVKKLEELGIGRPSTYASIIQVLQARNYVTVENKRFFPEDRGRIVTAFLENFFKKYVEYDFTANLETQLDEISAGDQQWLKVIRAFWNDFNGNVGEAQKLSITEVLSALDEDLGPHFFPETEDGSDPRQCPVCKDGRQHIKVGKFGAFIGCTAYPECKYTKPLAVNDESQDDDAQKKAELSAEPKQLGKHPESDLPITLRVGPYGPYVQVGDADIDKKQIKRAAIPKNMQLTEIDFDKAMSLLALPRDIGPHPETKDMISAGIGRFGPYLKIDGKFKSLPKDEDLLTIGLNRAVDILGDLPHQPKKKRTAPKRRTTKKKS